MRRAASGPSSRQPLAPQIVAPVGGGQPFPAAGTAVARAISIPAIAIRVICWRSTRPRGRWFRRRSHAPDAQRRAPRYAVGCALEVLRRSPRPRVVGAPDELAAEVDDAPLGVVTRAQLGHADPLVRANASAKVAAKRRAVVRGGTGPSSGRPGGKPLEARLRREHP